ncbi:fungal-specific transcription factor domain-containing protein [Cristinia sonorae]|uniref:Fungal-specific transcription factor domain-containing protein n=1 Tax=Cristinia sonorae TaxID=1940300 RepID=A0A8K0XU48_9AGAR|nr:fungal-specific transcription factor domain-containing protein [Cristinia sonorae]
MAHHHHQHQQHQQHMQQPSTSPSIPIDPALALYPPAYYYQQQPQQQQQPQHISHQHLTIPASMSSPSSSESTGTPPIESMSFPGGSNANGKRPASSLASRQQNDSRKKAKRDDAADAPSPATDKAEELKTKPTRGSRACTVCRRLKMKCVGAENGPPCKRCQTGNHECIFEESNRGKRSTKKHEILTRSLRKMERTLDTVLRSLGNPSLAAGMLSRSPSPSPQAQSTQALLASPSPSPGQSHAPILPGSPKLHSLPDNSLNPLGLLAEASLANRRAQQAAARSDSPVATSSADQAGKLGVASATYFKPGPMTILPLRRLIIERQIQPEMLSFVSTEEVVALFSIYYDKMNFLCNLLDPAFHTASLVCSRSPFLLTTICAIASRFYTQRPELHAKLSDISRKLAFSVPEKGYKSVEIVQAYLLNTLWGCGPVERYEQDRTWFLLGMAIRMATDLNLHRRITPTSADTAEGKARDREVHNRERTWILCFCLDRSFSAQMGKPYTIKEDFIVRNASQWCRSPVAVQGDIALAAYADLQRILTRSLDLLYSGTATASGLQLDSDYLLVITTMETQIMAWQHEWGNIRNVGQGEAEFIAKNRVLMGKFYFNYAMLIVNSFGLQNALERSAVDIGHFFARCHSSASACALLIRDDLAPLGYLRYAPDSNFVMGSYAVLSLMKLLRPEFQTFLDHEQKTISLVKDVADAFESVAVGALHTPALYSAFLRALLSAKIDTNPEASRSLHDGSTASGPQDGSRQTNGTGSSNGSMAPPSIIPSNNGGEHASNEFQFQGEMGPVADITTFPPIMAPQPLDSMSAMMSVDSILSTDFWDNVLVPGYSNTFEGLSGGYVYGAGGSGLITPGFNITPFGSVPSTPTRNLGELTQNGIDAAFNGEGISVHS